jgi:hypothetical protein
MSKKIFATDILLNVDVEMILDRITEYDHKYVTEANAEMLLSLMEQDISDWFYENIGSVLDEAIGKYIHEVMNPEKEYEHDV